MIAAWGFKDKSRSNVENSFNFDGLVTTKNIVWAGTAQQVFEWGGGVGAKEECVKENFGGGGRGPGGHACGFLFNFSKVTENANNDKAIDFFPHLQ